MKKDENGTSVYFSSKTDGNSCQRHVAPFKRCHVATLFSFLKKKKKFKAFFF